MRKPASLLFFTLILSGVCHAQELLPDIAVADTGQQVVINIPQLRLFLFENGKVRNIYPIAVGKNRTQTPLGEYTIRNKAYKPTWSIPLSIQKERAQQGLPALTSIPPGPDNPLGPVFARFGDPSLGLGIHGTNAPSSVPGWRSHGCVRMKSDNALSFAGTVETESPVSVIYQRYALNQDDNGQLWLAVYPNPYKQKDDSLSKLTETLTAWAQHNNAEIDIARLQQLLKKPTQPFCLTCTEKKPKITGTLHALAWNDGSYQIREPYVIDPPLPEVPYTIQNGVATVDYSTHEGMLSPQQENKAQELKPINASPVPASQINDLF